MKEKVFCNLYTSEGEQLSAQPWQDYPRPQMRRDSFFNLNGEWAFAVSKSEQAPQVFSKKILVPFAPQTLLSGVHRAVPEQAYLYYRRQFSLPQNFRKDRVILHFGAVDQIAAVWLNGSFLGEHKGGYEAFCFEITDLLQEENILLVRALDQLSCGVYPYGKQSANRGGMWYTPTSGIWQTVWLESVPQRYIKNLRFETEEKRVRIHAEGDLPNGEVQVRTPNGLLHTDLVDGMAELELPQPRLWSPEDPYLYECEITAGEDQVYSYFALRTLSVETVNDLARLCLNGKPYFFHGILDQGYWSDGLMTPADPSCYEKDILAMKELGFNMLRKHIKVEPEAFYYACDRLGMVVFQDMVNNSDYHFLRDTALPTVGLKRRSDRQLHRNPQSREAFLQGMRATVRQLQNHPSIFCWTIFNEGWGQFESDKAYDLLHELDATRWIDSTSGWFSGRKSDVQSEHVYFRPFRAKKTAKPLFLSEFGGYTLPVEGHLFNPAQSYGYRTFKSKQSYQDALITLYQKQIIPAVSRGLCATVYTQVSDVEDEINGLLTFDRRAKKVEAEAFAPIGEQLQNEIRT